MKELADILGRIGWIALGVAIGLTFARWAVEYHEVLCTLR